MSNETTHDPVDGSPATASAVPKPERFWSTIRILLWFGGPRPDYSQLDTNTRLAHERTDLALDRSYLACERTLQAWIRTALSMISFGFTLGKLGDAAKSIEIKGLFQHRQLGIEGIAYFLVVLGTLGLLAATVQHIFAVVGLRRIGLRSRPSIAFVIAILLTILGGFAFTALVLNL